MLPGAKFVAAFDGSGQAGTNCPLSAFERTMDQQKAVI
jgi:hypothetical protein